VKTKYLRRTLAAFTALAGLIFPAVTLASTTPNLTQTVNPGTLSSDIMQSNGTTPVASPTVAFSALNKSLTCQTATATLGDTNNKLYITNLAANGGWNLAIAATGGAAATWTAGTDTYKYNDATGSGCTNGQLTVDPSVATVTLDCNSACTATNVSKGTSTPFVSGTKDSITLVTDSDGSGWKGYLTGIGLSQKVPASQASGNYALGMTLTVTAQ
jgi:hypothetical protein